jgi:hypothetical protein
MAVINSQWVPVTAPFTFSRSMEAADNIEGLAVAGSVKSEIFRNKLIFF